MKTVTRTKRATRKQSKRAGTSPPEKDSYCYWSVADGDFALMAETMVRSARKAGVSTEFHIWSDQEIAGAVVHPIRRLKKDHYLFKLEFLRRHVIKLPHDYFVWLDADNYFVRDPGNILRVLGGAAVHASLESDFCGQNNIRPDWRGCPLPIYAHLMRSAGVRGKSIFNVNGGFWIVHRDAVAMFCELAFSFWEIGRRHGYIFTEEAPIAYATQMLCRNADAHQLRKWTDVWVTEWRGVFGKRLPNGQPWIFKDYFTFEQLKVNPAIIHAVASKDLMIAEARMRRDSNRPPNRKARVKPAPRFDDRADRSAAGLRRRGTR